MRDEQTPTWQKWATLTGIVLVVGVGSSLIVSMKWANRDSAKTLRYDMDSLRKTDPALLKYQEDRRIETGFKQVGGMALRKDGSLLVAGDKSVRLFDADGKGQREIILSAAPRCVAENMDGTLFIGVGDHIEVYNAEGTRAATWESFGRSVTVTAVVVAGDRVFAAYWENRSGLAVQCDKAGKVLTRFGARDDKRGIPGLVIPSPYLDIALSPDGQLLYVADTGRHRIEAYTMSGDLKSSVGQFSMAVEGFCGCCNPVAIALRPEGGFVTSEKGIGRVKLIGPDAQFECLVAAPETFAEETFGIAVALDERGRVYVLDTGARAVRVFSRKKEAGDAAPKPQ